MICPIWVIMGGSKLPREWVIMDDRGRLTIPAHIRKALTEGGDARVSIKAIGTSVLVEAYPDLENCKSIILRL